MTEKIAVYPGTFDPITLGHLDVIKRASKLFDKVIVAVTNNPAKKPLFSIKERVELIKEAASGLPVEVDSFSGLLVDYLKKKKVKIILRGLRELSDFTSEFQQAIINRKLDNGIETVLVITDAKYFYLNSTMVKEIASMGGELKCFVPKTVEKALKKKFMQ